MRRRAWMRRILRDRFGQKVMAPFGREPSPRAWLFIVGCYNSGTTLLHEILSTHPDVASLPGEGVYYTDALRRPERCGWNRLWHPCLDTIRIEPGPTGERRARRVKRQWSFLLEDRPVVLEKSISNSARIPFLRAHFTPAFFVYLVRNGYAAAEGIRRRANPAKWGRTEFGNSYPIGMCARQWAVTDDVVSRDLADCETAITLRYEELTADPSGQLRRVTELLNLGPLPDESLRASWRVQGRDSPIRNMNERSFANLTPDDILEIEKESGPVLAKYGYPRPTVPASGLD